MQKSILVLLVSLVSLAAVGGIVYTATKDKDSMDGSNAPHQSSMPATPNSSTTENTADSSGTAVETSTVTIENYAFSPANIRVKKGTTVTWTNQDSVKHDVMPDKPSDAFKASKLLGKGESYSFTFNAVGTYDYICSPHPYMKASVEVVE